MEGLSKESELKLLLLGYVKSSPTYYHHRSKNLCFTLSIHKNKDILYELHNLNLKVKRSSDDRLIFQSWNQDRAVDSAVKYLN